MLTIEEIRHANLHLLAQKGLKQAELARELGIDRRQVNQWFVTPPLRDLSSDYARQIEEKLVLETGSLDHPGMVDWASQPSRPDPEILADAIELAMASDEELTAERILAAYDLLTSKRAPVVELKPRPRPKPGGPGAHGVVEGRDSGAVEDPRRKGRTGT